MAQPSTQTQDQPSSAQPPSQSQGQQPSGTTPSQKPSQPPSGTSQGEPKTPGAQPGQPSGAGAQAHECPEFMKGSKLKVSDTKDGVAITVTTDQKGNVDELRKLVGDVATAVDQQSKAQPKAQAQSTGSEQQMPALDVTTKNVDGGSKVTIRPEDQAKLDLVRTQARKLETAWQSSTCAKGSPAAG
jgi:hypothetical protein